MSLEDLAVNLYLDDEKQTGNIPVPVGHLFPGEPFLVQYELRNDSKYPVQDLTVKISHPKNIVSITNILPTKLYSGDKTPLLITWKIDEFPKIYGEEKWGPARLEADWNVVIEGSS